MPAAGSSSSSSSGSVISARAICTRLRSPSLSVPNDRSARCATPSAVQQPGGAAHVQAAVRLAPAAEHRVPGADHDVDDASRVAGCAAASAALASPIRGRSSNTSTLPSRSPSTYASPAEGCRMRRGDLQQGGLARRRWARGSPSARPPRPSSRCRRSSSVVPRRTDTSTNCSTASGLISATRQSKRTRRVAARACQSAGPTTSVTVALCDAPSGPVQETFTDCPGR